MAILNLVMKTMIYDYKILASNGTCIHYGIISVNKKDKRKIRKEKIG